MRRIVSLSLLVALLVIITGCTTAKLGGLQMTKDLPTFEVVKDFETTVKINKFLGSAAGKTLFNIGAESTEDPIFDAVQREIAKLGGDAAVDISITYGATVLDLVLNGITGALYAPATVTITGTVVKY